MPTSKNDNQTIAQTTGTGQHGSAGNSAEAGGGSGLQHARDRAADGLEAARAGVSTAFDAARERAGAAYESARGAAAQAGERAAAQVEENPLGVLVGGLALGAVIGALLPRSEREVAALAPLGAKLRDAATTAGNAAKTEAKSKLAEYGLSEGVLDKAKGLLDKAAGTGSSEPAEAQAS